MLRGDELRFGALFFMMLILLALPVMAQTIFTTSYEKQIADGPRMRVSLINQDPDPVAPGSYIELRWKIDNLGSTKAKDVTFELIEEYPFSITPGSSALQELGDPGHFPKA